MTNQFHLSGQYSEKVLRRLPSAPARGSNGRSYRGSGHLAGRRALITGGDSGIGRAVAIACAREGADIAINYLPQEEPDAAEVIDLIRREGWKAVAIPGDLRTEEFCRSLVARATKAAMVAFTCALAKQVARRGIRGNGVALGAIRTPMQESRTRPAPRRMRLGIRHRCATHSREKIH